MSFTRSSPSCESRRRETASYSYRPCCALVVDLMCHCSSGMPRAAATSSASMVLPVPGSPLMSRGRCRVIAALTASLRSSVATYCDEPSKRITRPSEKEKLQYKSEGFWERRPRNVRWGGAGPQSLRYRRRRTKCPSDRLSQSPGTPSPTALRAGADPAAAGGRRVGRAVQLARFFWPAWLENGNALQGTIEWDHSMPSLPRTSV